MVHHGQGGVWGFELLVATLWHILITVWGFLCNLFVWCDFFHCLIINEQLLFNSLLCICLSCWNFLIDTAIRWNRSPDKQGLHFFFINVECEIVKGLYLPEKEQTVMNNQQSYLSEVIEVLVPISRFIMDMLCLNVLILYHHLNPVIFQSDPIWNMQLWCDTPQTTTTRFFFRMRMRRESLYWQLLNTLNHHLAFD